MIAIRDIFEGKLKTGFKEAGRSALASAGLGLKSAGQVATSTGEAVHDKFTKNQNKLEKNAEVK